MKKYLARILLVSILSVPGFAKESEVREDWREIPNHPFTHSEENFKLVIQKLMDKYIDKNLSKDDLYRAATAGMLASLNPGEKNWNKLLSPTELQEMQIDLSGKVSGIGAEMKFDETHGYAQILRVIPSSPAEKAGVKVDDQILTVNGKKFKGKGFHELVYSIRGEIGKSVDLKILRDDKILNLTVKREIIPWTPIDLQKIDESTTLLTIGYFNTEAPKLVEKYIHEINSRNFKKLIVDLRDSAGGGFNEAINTADLFLPKDSIIVRTKNRSGKVEEFKSTKGLLNNNVQIILLTNNGTYCGAELFVAALKENRKLKIVGETTSGKWNAQTVEILPNNFAVKYTISEFESPTGHSYQNKGIKPDLEVGLPKDIELRELRLKLDLPKRIATDTQLKAALELIKSI